MRGCKTTTHLLQNTTNTPTTPHPTHTRLSNSQGNLLDDTQLIDVLAVTKQTAQDVSDRLANASETNRKINDACEEYRAVRSGLKWDDVWGVSGDVRVVGFAALAAKTIPCNNSTTQKQHPNKQNAKGRAPRHAHLLPHRRV
jgi:hypothetical protein